MSITYRYKCNTELVAIVEDRFIEQGLPTSCKNNASHTITDITIIKQGDLSAQNISGLIGSRKQNSYLCSGGVISEHGTGMHFIVTPLTYVIDGVLYRSDNAVVQLSTANGTFDRIDTIYADTNLNVDKLTGTPSASPVKPELSIGQLELLSVRVPAGASTPDIKLTTLYNENAQQGGGEYNISENTGGARINSASTNDPLLGATSIELSGMVNGDHIDFTTTTPDLLGEMLSFYFKSTSVFPVNLYFRVALFNNGDRISKWVNIYDGLFGFKKNGVGYQAIAISFDLFEVTNLYDKIRIELYGTGNETLNGFIDVVQSTNAKINPTVSIVSNGYGESLVAQTVGGLTELKSIGTSDPVITISGTTTTIDISVNQSAISHSNLSGLENDDHTHYVLASGARDITGDQNIVSTSQTTAVGNGAFYVAGGTSIGRDLRVGGNTYLEGSLTVLGTTTTVESEVTVVADNTFVINSAPGSTKDSGYFIQRYQTANNSSSDDVVNGMMYITGTSVSGTSTTFTMPAVAPWSTSSDDDYNGYWIIVTSGTGSGQVRRIKDWDSTTRTATIYSTADGGTQGLDFVINLDGTSVIEFSGCAYTGLFFDETVDKWIVGCTPVDTLQNVNYEGRMDLEAGNIDVTKSLTVSQSINNASDVGDLLVGNGTTMTVLSIGNHDDILVVSTDQTTGFRYQAINLDAENNTASNVGAGLQVYKQKTGFNLEFRTIVEGNGVDLTQGADTITVVVNESELDHGLISGLGDDDHPQYVLADGTRDITGPIYISSTTEAYSTTTGALTVAGGVGIEGNLFVGGTVTTFGGDIIVTGSITTDGGLNISSTDNSFSTTTGALQIAGGLGVKMRINGAGDVGDLLVGSGGIYGEMTRVPVGTNETVVIADSTQPNGVRWDVVNAVQLQTYPIENTQPSIGDVLKWDGTQWATISIETASVFLFPLFQREPNGSESISISTNWGTYGQIGWDQSKYNQLTTTSVTCYVDITGRNLRARLRDIKNNTTVSTFGEGPLQSTIVSTGEYISFSGIVNQGIIVVYYNKPLTDTLLTLEFQSGTNVFGNTPPNLYQAQLDFGF